MTPPVPTDRVSLVSKVIQAGPPLRSKTKKYLHAAIQAAVAGGLSFLAFNLDTIIVVPKGLKGVGIGILMLAVSRAAGAILAELPTHPETTSAPQ